VIVGAWVSEDLPTAPLDAPLDHSAVRAELEAAGAVDRESAHELRRVSEAERERAVARATVTRRNLAEQEAKATRPLTPDEQADLDAIAVAGMKRRVHLEAEKERLGLATLAETLEVTEPLDVLFPHDDRRVSGGITTAADEEPETRAEPAIWPDPLAEPAYHGVLGDIARAVAPHTEADPVGVLGTLLAMFGSACGGGRALYQGSLQRTNLSLLLVGETGFRGRKGTTLDVARGVFGLAYPELEGLWLPGVASGEAITGHLGRHEAEFGRLLTIMNREGSTLSAVLRNAWDGVPLGHARARDESLVARHHVTLIGHVTPIELRAKLTDTDAANGFANRLLFLAVRRSRLIPFPTPPDEIVREFVEPLHSAIMEAQLSGKMVFDAAARDRWEEFYEELAVTPRLGLVGAVTGRHEAHVARLALIYALADRSPVIGAAHLEAAIAIAEYARRSAVWTLGDSTGNRHADVLRRMLADGELPWQEAKVALGLRTAADMAEAVAVLVDAGLAEVVKVPREGPAGRPRQVIRPGTAKGANGANSARGARTEERGNAT
jgi:hypothetical protein